MDYTFEFGLHEKVFDTCSGFTGFVSQMCAGFNGESYEVTGAANKDGKIPSHWIDARRLEKDNSSKNH